MVSKDCIVPVYLAYLMAIYLLASIYYLLMTTKLGTPFKDSLTEEQLLIKKTEAKKRKEIFVTGVVFSGILLIYTEPFKKCPPFNQII